MTLRSKRTKELIALTVSLAVAFVTTARADIINVPGDFPTIQAAIDAAVDGDEVEVHPGTYFETINFLGKAIRVYSTDGPDVTIIDAQQAGTVVTCDSAEGPDSVLEGFTITGGNAGLGGGMRIINSSPTVTNCTFSGNTAAACGGMYNLDKRRAMFVVASAAVSFASPQNRSGSPCNRDRELSRIMLSTQGVASCARSINVD